MNKIKFACYQLNTLSIDPENDDYNNKVNACYVSDLFNLANSTDLIKIAKLFLKFSSNSPERETGNKNENHFRLTSELKCQVQCLEFPDISDQFITASWTDDSSQNSQEKIPQEKEIEIGEK